MDHFNSIELIILLKYLHHFIYLSFLQAFFKDLDDYSSQFAQFYRTGGECDGVRTPPAQLESMSKRFKTLAVKEV